MTFINQYLPTKKTSLLLLVLVLLVATPQFASANFLHDAVYGLVTTFLGFFFGLSGYLLDWSINQTVIGFGEAYRSDGYGYSVDTLWVTIRDLFNMTFIFGLVYIGFKMILDSENSSTRRWLGHLVMAALLVNFSLFITKVVVDFTNILATQIATTGFTVGADGGVDVSETFMQNFGMTSFFNTVPDQVEAPWAYIFGSAIVLIVGIFVFAAGAFLLLLRFVSILLYMIFSPLMFIGWVFPSFQNVTSKYWRGFLSRAFFAPIYILLIYISSQIIYTMYAGKPAPNFARLHSGNPNDFDTSFGATFPPFILSAFFLVASVIVASKLGTDGAGAVMKAGGAYKQKIQRGVGSMTAGSAAWAGRRSVGWAANRAENSERFRNFAARNTLGKYALKGTSKVAGASFDARNAFGAGAALGVGTGAKGGYNKIVKDKKKADKDFAESLGKNNKYNADGSENKSFKKEVDKLVDKKIEALEKAEGSNAYKDAKADIVFGKGKKAEAETTLAEKQSETTKLEDKISELENKLKTAPPNQPISEKREIEKELESTRAKQTEFKTEITGLESEITKAEEQVKKANELIEATQAGFKQQSETEHTYARQIAYMKQLEGNRRDGLKSSVQTTGVGMLLGPVGAAVGAGVGVGFASQATLNQESRNELLKEYGIDGSNKQKSEKHKNDMRVLAELQKEYSDNSNVGSGASEADSNKDN